jgi:peptidase M1-like protein
MSYIRFILPLVTAAALLAQSPISPIDKFRQLDERYPTPSEYRTASGAPGHKYWQQRADYDIDVAIDDENQRLTASAQISYHNNSPDELTYLWLQLDQNIWDPHSDAILTRTVPDWKKFPFSTARTMMDDPFPGGYAIAKVADAAGAPLHYWIQGTMMRIDLKQPLPAGASTGFAIDWSYNINPSKKIRGRTGAEFFKKDGNWIYGIAQWFPRMAAYYDTVGWQHKQFLGSGEFTLEFGDYKVRITVPDDHIVSSTGVLQNPEEVLTATQRQRLEAAHTAKKPLYIVTPDEALAAEKGKPTGTKTWVFHAENVRDFAFASSRKFMWDAQGHDVEGNQVMAMSYFPKEANPLWEQYSTASIIHTLNVYSRYSFAYPYPIAISVNGVVGGGMEYPMICFNGPRPLEDGTYSRRRKYGLISVIIHEVGHNYFPMIVNSDERQWTWMDEGINTFLQYLSEQEWEDEYPSRNGEPAKIVDYMVSETRDPIMTNSETVIQLGPNAYSKPMTALNILRETVLGRELFDFAFREYSRRWKFKRPTPYDFFRTMEDASGVDLDWFWRGWFYTNEYVDVAIAGVRQFNIDTKNPEIENPIKKRKKDEEPETLSERRNKELPKFIEERPELADFYNEFDEFTVTGVQRRDHEKYLKKLKDEEKAVLNPDFNFYSVDLKNLGGLVTPVILKLTYTDGTEEELRIPAEIWRRNNIKVSRPIATPRTLASVEFDPNWETSDVDVSNNHFPRQIIESKFELYKRKDEKINPMNEEEELKKEKDSNR